MLSTQGISRVRVGHTHTGLQKTNIRSSSLGLGAAGQQLHKLHLSTVLPCCAGWRSLTICASLRDSERNEGLKELCISQDKPLFVYAII